MNFVFFNYEKYCVFSDIIISFKYSFEFNYCSNDMKKVINEIVKELEQISFDKIPFRMDEDMVYKSKFNDEVLPILNKLFVIWEIFDNKIN